LSHISVEVLRAQHRQRRARHGVHPAKCTETQKFYPQTFGRSSVVIRGSGSDPLLYGFSHVKNYKHGGKVGLKSIQKSSHPGQFVK